MEMFKNIKSKIVIITVIVILVNFVFAKPVSAKSFLETAGGKLIQPICELFVFVRRLCIKYITN